MRKWSAKLSQVTLPNRQRQPERQRPKMKPRRVGRCLGKSIKAHQGEHPRVIPYRTELDPKGKLYPKDTELHRILEITKLPQKVDAHP